MTELRKRWAGGGGPFAVNRQPAGSPRQSIGRLTPQSSGSNFRPPKLFVLVAGPTSQSRKRWTVPRTLDAMGKRVSQGPSLGNESRKRQKVVHEVPTSEEVHSARQLVQLLFCDQDLSKARHGLQSFKLLLDHLTLPETPENSQHWAILRQFLDATAPRDAQDADAVFVPDIMATWALAAQAGNDEVLSSVAVVLALLVKILSQVLDMRSHGLGICRTLLQRKQLELLAKNLSAEKSKSFIISPTLRLIREAISFDGGLLASAFFRARKFTYHSFSRNMRIKFLGDGVEDRKRSSTRTCAIRLLISTLRFLPWEAKRELLYERDLAAALTSSIKDDPHYLVLEVLDGLKSHVLLDKKLPAETKGRLLNSTTLPRFALLYSYSHSDQAQSRPIDDAVHEFLMAACTTPGSGVLRSDSGLYPKGINVAASHMRGSTFEHNIGLDRIVWMDRFANEIPVHNSTLSEFVKTLRPWTSIKQSELLVSILQAAPELIADYFMNKKDFSFEPKLSATWIGYAALIYSTMQLDLPPFFGQKDEYAQVPPPISIILDNILPLTLNQKVLCKCLSHDIKLISFFATRILVVALQKLEVALRMMKEASLASGSVWSEASRRLMEEFMQRCPSLSYVTTTFRRIPEEDSLSREAASRLSRLYYHIVPQIALAAKFDVSPLLVNAIKRLDSNKKSDQNEILSLMELENLVVIAKSSPGMRWFAKAEQLSISPFTALLRVCVNAPKNVPLGPLEDALTFVADEHDIFLPASEGLRPCHLLMVLKTLNDRADLVTADGFWAFLDNCLHRCSASPIRYLESVQELAPETRTGPLTATIHEQLPFAVALEAATIGIVKDFVSVYTTFARILKEHKPLLKTLQKTVGAQFDDVLLDDSTFKKTLKQEKRTHLSSHHTTAADTRESSSGTGGDAEDDGLMSLVAGLDPTEPDNSALTKWTSQSVDDIVEEGFATALIRLLVSEHVSIRKEALTNILKMAEKVKQSTYEEREQVWLLLVELAESCRETVDTGSVPGHIVAFACRALDVLKNPLHCLYDKVNVFLTRGPQWTLDRFPLLYDVLQEAPSRDDSYYAAVAWLLGYLLESLRTPADLALFHKRRVYERILSLASNGYMRTPLRSVLLKILYRTTSLEGGSTTLITRFGIISWLEAQQSQRPSKAESDMLKALQRRLWETCDRSRIDEWSRQGIGLALSD
ncbi:hypothetical protein PspLS_08967 [Pyricularia sp. CBS 133598]|nr:hypothetical protein PspLS_08967 [Pyricularia sp. CBS 133598]